MFIRRKYWRIIWITLALILFSFALCIALIFVIEKPGGLSDQRWSRATGLKETISIPIGKNPDDALQQFWGGLQSMQVVHRETVKGGILLFTKRFSDQSNLRVDFVRKTFLGWKWVWGGGFGVSKTETALSYMSMSKLNNVTTPFPMVFGEVLDPRIKNVSIMTMDKINQSAKLIEIEPEKKIWFVLLPQSTSTPFEIDGYSQEGMVMAKKAVNVPDDSGWIDIL